MHKKGGPAAGPTTAAAPGSAPSPSAAAASFKVNATPFVPSVAGVAPTPAVASTPAVNFKVSATPFVPSGPNQSAAATPPQPNSARAGHASANPVAQLALTAQPFVPAATRAATTTTATAATTTPSVPAHVRQQSNTASSPHRGRTPPTTTMPASPAATSQSAPVSAAAAVVSPPLSGRGTTMGRGGRTGVLDHNHHTGYQGGRGRAGNRAVGFSPTENYPSSPGMSGVSGRGPLGVSGGAGQGSGVIGSPAMSPVPPRLPGYRPMHSKPQAMGRTPLARQFLDEKLKQQLAAASYTVHAQWTSSTKDGFSFTLPERIGHYHTLLPLEHPAALGHSNNADGFSHALGLKSLVLKGVSSMDGQPYVLRRIDGKQVVPSQDVLSCALQAVDTWAPLAEHPHMVALRSAFVSSEVDSSSAQFFVYDFHPGSVTLAAAHLTPAVGVGGMVSVQPPTEAQLWSYLVQLASIMRAAHMHGLALRPSSLHASKVLVSPTGRVRVNCCGLVDTVAGDAAQEREDMAHAHRVDLMALGQLLLCLACAGLVPAGHGGSLDVLSSSAGVARVSPELCRLIAALLAAPDGGMLGSVRQLCTHPAVVEHTMVELEASHSMQDMLVNELSKECENGRLLRLLVKLGFVVERPQGDVDGSWAETGDRYLLKLFRDFVFHQRVPDGSPGAGGPLLDWGYVLEALNKLDAGVPERIMLLSRDETAMLIASYADLKRCVENSYADLQTRGVAAAAASKGMVGT